MALISVAGATSRAGKTALAASLLRGLSPGSASAVKFTTTDDVFERCPRGKPCLVCDIDRPFRLVTEESVLRERGTDTDRLAEAGARRVVWAIARRSAVAVAWAAVTPLVAGGPVVMEGSAITFEAKPALTFFVVHPFLDPARWKESASALLDSADCVVVNRPANETREPAAAVLEAIHARRGRRDVRIADVTAPLAAWGSDWAERVATLAGEPALSI